MANENDEREPLEAALRRGETMIAALQRSDAYPHSVGAIELLETHASWILLAGEYAYKVKKALDLGFLDFSTLERRRHFCEEELRLNRRLAPDLYLDVVDIIGPPEHARIVEAGAAGEVLEVAVRMGRFPQSALLGNAVARGELDNVALDALAVRVARFHSEIAPREPVGEWGAPEAIRRPVEENLEVLRSASLEPGLASRIDELARSSQREFERLLPAFERRRAGGFVRECHGDMHLDNMILENGEVVIFDGIEFSPNLRWIDTMSEVAFTVMDFYRRGRRDFGNRFLNAYLEASGDYEGLEVFSFYATYRALVRAKVDEIRLEQEALDSSTLAERSRLAEELLGYVAIAEHFSAQVEPRLLVTYGLSGSGKTTGTQEWVERDAAIRVRSDVERKRLHDLEPLDASDSGLRAGIYSDAATVQTRQRLLEVAERILASGFTAIVDATFLRRADRAPFRDLAQRLGVRFEILAFDASPDVLRQRINARAAKGADASEATLDVLELQLRTAEPPEEGEADRVNWTRSDGS